MKKCLSSIAIIILLLVALTGCAVQDNNSKKQEKSIAGESFVESHENSLIKFDKKGNFKYYKSEDDLNDNYYEGTYEFYCGSKAKELVTGDRFSEYGVTSEELSDYFERNKDSEIYNEDNICLLVLTNKKIVIDGEEKDMKNMESPYYGFYYNDVLDVVKMNSGTTFTFEKVK